MTDTFGHIVERETIHFLCSLMVVWVYLLIHAIKKRVPRSREWLPEWWKWKEQLMIGALTILIVAAAREAYDVWNHGWMPKSYIDIGFWAFGLVVNIGALIRFCYLVGKSFQRDLVIRLFAQKKISKEVYDQEITE